MKRITFFKRFFAVSFPICSLFIMLPYKTLSVFAETSYSKAECVMEMNSRRVLYETRGDVRLPMASTTKIATAITVLELCEDIKKEITIPPEAVGIEGSSVYLKNGDVYSVEDLLYGLMLRSGNDCATALALYCCGGINEFSAKMNETAQKAGALSSNFKNPHGLPCDGHYTTARDLTGIACYAMQNPVFRKIVRTQYYEPRHWKNKNKMLTNYEGGIGIKTGYTKQAGRCLVSAAERNGMALVCSVLNSPQMYERSARLMDDAFSAYRYIQIIKADEPFTLDDEKTVKTGCTKQDFFYPLLPEEIELIEIKVSGADRSKKSVKNNEIIGQIEIYLLKRLLFSANLYKL